MTIPTGIALPSCKTPTIHAAVAAALNCKQPSIADALPARAPWPLMAQADALGMMQPRLAIQINSGISSGHNCSVCNELTPSNVSPAAR